MKLPKCWTWVAFLDLSGCQTTAQFLDSKQNAAVDTAVKGGRFEMNCPEATGTVLSREAV
jgi:ligand-binding SRPBCC domain-containing protein